MKRIISLILCALMTITSPAVTAFAKPAWPADTGIESESGIVMDVDSKAVLFGQGIHIQKAPASITKLLTALVAVENSKLSDTVTFSNGAVYDVESGSGNKLALDEGDQLTVEDCLYLLLLQSSNQAANALAEHVAGSRDGFVDLMNEKVAELGLENSHFANPSGLNDDNQYTSAYDMALISIAAYENPTVLKIGSAKSWKIPATKNNPNGATFAMEHKLLTTTDPGSSTYFPYALAGKTGYTSIAGQTLVTYAEKDGRRLICVTLKSTAVTHYKDSIALLSFGFDRFSNINMLEHEQPLAGAGPFTIGGADYEASDLSISPTAAITLPAGAAITDTVRTVDTALPENHPDGAVGILTYSYDDRKVGQAYIISARKVVSDATAPDNDDSEAVTASVADENASADKSPDKKSPDKEENADKKFSVPVKGILTAFVILAAGAAACGGFYLYRKKKEEERQMLAERRRRRMQRLEEQGYSREEFDKLLERRLSDGRRDTSKSSGKNERRGGK